MIRLAAMAGLLVTLAACRQTGHHADATGMFESTEVVVSAQVAGPLWRLDVEEGDSLMAGQEVALVDTVALSLQRDRLEADWLATADQRSDVGKQVAATRRQIARAQLEVDRCRRWWPDRPARSSNWMMPRRNLTCCAVSWRPSFPHSRWATGLSATSSAPWRAGWPR